MASKREPTEFSFELIERTWQLSPLFDSPAVGRDTDGVGFYIRVVTGVRVHGDSTTTTYDYFRTDRDGVIIQAPRGHAKDYRPGRILGMRDAWAKHVVTGGLPS